ncbi:hypothetical protein V9V09_003909 [Salmonella enterica subsp. enterica serovar Braenderup]
MLKTGNGMYSFIRNAKYFVVALAAITATGADCALWAPPPDKPYYYEYTWELNGDISTRQNLGAMVIDVLTSCNDLRIRVDYCHMYLKYRNGSKSMKCLNNGYENLMFQAPDNPQIQSQWDSFTISSYKTSGRISGYSSSSSCSVMATVAHGTEHRDTQGTMSLALRSSSGRSEVLGVAGDGLRIGVLTPERGTGAALIKYPDYISGVANADGSFRHRAVEALDRTATISLKYRIYNQNWASDRFPLTSDIKLIKSDGTDCTNLKFGDSCDLYFPPGSAPVGRLLEGRAVIDVTVQ